MHLHSYPVPTHAIEAAALGRDYTFLRSKLHLFWDSRAERTEPGLEAGTGLRVEVFGRAGFGPGDASADLAALQWGGELAGFWDVFGAGFLTLVGLMCGHLLVETVRDAVLLANVSPTVLPSPYIAIAVVSLGAVRMQRWVGSRYEPYRALIAWMGLSATLVGTLWFLLDNIGDFTIYVLYVLPGVLLTVALVQFWALISGAMTMRVRAWPFWSTP